MVTAKKKSLNKVFLMGLLIVSMMVGFVVFRVKSRLPSYDFLGHGLPDSLFEFGSDKWAIYDFDMLDSNKDIVQRARAELIPLGFVEDSSQKPWVRFTKGKLEVAIVESDIHRDINYKATAGLVISFDKSRELTERQRLWRAIVKNGKGTEMSTNEFEIRRRIKRIFVTQ